MKNKIPDHSNYITTPEFDKLTTEHFTARLALGNLTTKSGIANIVKNADFDGKLKNLNKNFTSNEKKKHVLVENELNELSEKIKVISAKGLRKDLTNKFLILNDAK